MPLIVQLLLGRTLRADLFDEFGRDRLLRKGGRVASEARKIAEEKQRLTVDIAKKEDALKEPAPQASLSAFGADGLQFTVGYWINSGDAAEQLRLLSRINRRILESLQANAIEMAYPQRVLRVKELPPLAGARDSAAHQAG